MKHLTPDRDNKTFDEEYMLHQNPDGTPTCVCGWSLTQVDEDTWRCTGGNEKHTYRISRGDAVVDKYGNLMIRMPEGSKT